MESLFIFRYLTYWQPLGYLLIIIGMVIEGDSLLFLIAFLASQGLFNPSLIFIIAVAGAVGGDALWYWLGKRVKSPHSIFRIWTEKVVMPFDNHLREKTLRTIFLSKFVYGLHHPLLIRAGILKIRLKELLKYDFISATAWTIIVGGLGYFSGSSFNLFSKYLHFFEYALFGGLIIFLIFWHYLSDFLKKEI